ncbi:DoxX family membrane protein [Pseudonocardia endophytica]|uniref:Thiosulfate dehydrogenase [quinone] large subunit n=1 Tax=Pseudonocardia endophytica TaxID=401976 RepID=A0A4R1HQV1_PSEEN|nr:DoxX family membrane protein [Pseudonocardia endophytica]TCK22139.1 thiosulfate dehydrogenase [quinone] large subunit [Pseudonocardia endophytica]
MTTESATRTPDLDPAIRPVAGRSLALLRVATGFVFLWAFADKLFGLGFTTPAARAWIHGGSPTRGFLSNVDIGPLAPVFRAIAGAWWADVLFMAGLAAIGVAVILGAGLRVAAISGALMMALMYLAELPFYAVTNAGEPTGSTNPIVDYHLVYALVLIVVALTRAGDTWGLGRWWATTRLVRRTPWLT